MWGYRAVRCQCPLGRLVASQLTHTSDSDRAQSRLRHTHTVRVLSWVEIYREVTQCFFSAPGSSDERAESSETDTECSLQRALEEVDGVDGRAVCLFYFLK